MAKYLKQRLELLQHLLQDKIKTIYIFSHHGKVIPPDSLGPLIAAMYLITSQHVLISRN